MLTMTGVKIIGGAEIATISAALPSSGGMYGHSNEVTVTVTAAIVPGFFPVGTTFEPSADTRRRCGFRSVGGRTRNGVPAVKVDVGTRSRCG